MFLMAVLYGVAVQAKAGFSRDVLQTVAEQGLAIWPMRSVKIPDGAIESICGCIFINIRINNNAQRVSHEPIICQYICIS